MSNTTPTKKVVLITGAARRIGAEIARMLHCEKMNIAIHYHESKKEADALCNELNTIRAQSAILIQGDLNQKTTHEKMLETVLSTWGQLDVLINNASRYYKTQLNQPNENNWTDLLDTNAKAPFFISCTAAPFLKKQKGCIINIADIHGIQPMRDYAMYCVSKAALIMVTKTLAKEFAPDIRANAIAPGPILWPEGDNALTPELKEKLINLTALKKPGFATHIAEAVLFLINSADYITGQVLTVDGGRT